MKLFRLSALWMLVLMATAGCLPEHSREVVVYCALDKEFSEPILNQFEQQTGIRVLAKYDVESNKTVGLANEIIALKKQQRCDVFWNNEILHTLRMDKLGLLGRFDSKEKTKFPSQFVSPDGRWIGFAARARVLLVNVEKLPDRQDWPVSVRDLANPQWENNCGIAKPLFGTTATHAAVLFAEWGKPVATDFFKQVAANAVVEGGNKQVAINVSRGKYAFGLTDTDDAIIEIEQGNPVAIVFPDQQKNQTGTLLIPNTLAVTKGKNPVESAQLLEFLLSPAVERQLANGRSAQIPLHADVAIKSRIQPDNLKVMEVDFRAAAEVWNDVKSRMIEIFAQK